MSRDIMGGAIVAAGIWAIFAIGSFGLIPATPRGPAWTVTGSEMIRSHPELVRIAPPAAMAGSPERGRQPEG
jgi:hypothetical protein